MRSRYHALLASILAISLFSLPTHAAIQDSARFSSYGEIGSQPPIYGIHTNGTDFVLNGESIRLTGVHMTLWLDSDERYEEKYFDWLRDWNINTILLNFGWNFLEPTKGVYDQEYLGKMDRFVDKAKTRGIYVILRMHKWAYPDAYQAQYPDNPWILGFPAWIDDTPDFWENVGNCWDNYVSMWTLLAEHYKDEPYVAGLNLFGEPGTDIGPGIYDPVGMDWQTWGCKTCRKVMGVLFDEDKLYERTTNAIHSLCPKVVIIEGFAYGILRYLKNANDTKRTDATKPNSSNFAIGQSVYSWFLFEWLDGDLKAMANIWDIPCMATEFGVQVDQIESPQSEKVTWVERACQAFSTRNMGWYYWGFGPGPGGDFNLVEEFTDTVSPILSEILPVYSYGLLPSPL